MKNIARIACCGIAAVAIDSAGSAVLAAAAGPFHDQPASARSLPGDNLPPFEMLDEAGRADGADGSHVFVAMRKALAALAFNVPSSALSTHIAADQALLARVTPAMFIAGGAVLGQQDEICALAGLNRIRHRLK